MANKLQTRNPIGEETAGETASRLLDYIAKHLHRRKLPDRRVLRDKLLKLGLLDQLLQLMVQSTLAGDSGLETTLEHIERVIENRYFGTLDTVNPILKRSTLKLIGNSLSEEDDKDLTMNVITFVIFTITIFLIKLDSNNTDLVGESMPDLEVAFEFLARHLNELTFSASDMLVRATNSLVDAIKSKLDVLADNELIRESFKTLAETVAGRCLIESRYKGAAMLYSQIEDNVNAVKALMRAGDVNIVMDFALLVRDINVTRITINYLKHLRVDIKIIEDFIARASG